MGRSEKVGRGNRGTMTKVAVSGDLFRGYLHDVAGIPTICAILVPISTIPTRVFIPVPMSVSVSMSRGVHLAGTTRLALKFEPARAFKPASWILGIVLPTLSLSEA